jgi:pimeloyl-ACP methyl ester carboxylesterase
MKALWGILPILAALIVAFVPATGQSILRPFVNIPAAMLFAAVLIATSSIRGSLAELARRGALLTAVFLGTLFLGFFFFPVSTRGSRELPVAPPNSPATSLRSALETPWDSFAQPDWQAAPWMATLSQSAYQTPFDAETRIKALGFENFHWVDEGSSGGFVASIGDLGVIAFEGTNGLSDVGDWIFNLATTRVETQHGYVHGGFHRAWQSLAPQVRRILESKGIRRVWITGHSLGGAIALQAALDLQSDPSIELLGVMTFGQPLALDGAVSRWVDRSFGHRFVRFVNEDDVVPRLMPGYWPGGRYVWLSKGKLNDGPETRFTTVAGEGGDFDPKDAFGTSNESVAPELLPMTNDEFDAIKEQLRQRSLPVATDGGPIASALPNTTDHDMARYVSLVESYVATLATPDSVPSSSRP